MRNNRRASQAHTVACCIRRCIRTNRLDAADAFLDMYLKCFGATPAYNRLSREVQFALYNQQKGGK